MVDDIFLVNAELALVYGAFSFQSEYFYSNAQSDGGRDIEFDGIYVQASYFITGEHRPYKRSKGRFVRVTPRSNFHDDGGGPGAWQVALRYDLLDLTDGAVAGGEQETFTFGVNWHWNPHARIMLNAVFADIDGLGDLTILQTRFQFDF